MHTIVAILIGLAAGVLAGLMGVGGGFILVPTLVYLLGMDQHVAQGTSLFVLLPPLGLGALWVYWKKNAVDLQAGIVCAAGFLAGGFFGAKIAVGISSRSLKFMFGVFLMFAAVTLWRRALKLQESKGRHA
jgi:uncharacterized protein